MSADHTRSFWICPPGRGEIRREPLPAPGAGDVLVRTLYSGISRGTETLVFRGEVPASRVCSGCARRSRRATFPAPVKYGYVNVGVVEDGPPGWPRPPVFCLYPHQTRYVVPAAAVRAAARRRAAARAVLAANVETAVNALWDAAPRIGDRIAVIGGGALGLPRRLAGRRASPAARCSWSMPIRRARPSRTRSASRFARPDAAPRGAIS